MLSSKSKGQDDLKGVIDPTDGIIAKNFLIVLTSLRLFHKILKRLRETNAKDGFGRISRRIPLPFTIFFEGGIHRPLWGFQIAKGDGPAYFFNLLESVLRDSMRAG